MPRYIDAEKMPHGELWEQLTDKEKANVLCYLISQPGIDVTRKVFEAIESILVESSDTSVMWTTKEALEYLKEEYGLY